MKTLEELHAHYRAVRQRLDNPPVKKPTLKLVTHLDPVAAPEPEPTPVPIPAPVPAPFQMPATPARTILNEVAEKYGMTVQAVQSACRKKNFVAARQEASYRMSSELKFTLNQIGKLVGGRDHTTVLHAIRRHQKNLALGGEPWASKLCVTSACDKGTITQALEHNV